MASKSAPSSIVLTQIFSSFGIYTAPAVLEPISSGLIHSTWKIMNESDAFVLQRVNKAVFADPEAVCNNARLLSQYLTARDPTYLFICPLVTASGRMTLDIDGETYRMLPFVKNSCVYEVAISPEIAGAAARSFGRLTFMLSDFDCSNLHVSIPRFHDISLRYQQFEGALVEGDRQRIEKSSGLIEFLKSQKHIVDAYFDLLYDPNFKIRVTHHDTKISNVLFDATDSNRALCVIDLDTLMPGYFISDIGDMIRTYCCTANEEEVDFDKIEFRDDVYYALVNGYLAEMEDLLSDNEKECFVFAGKYMIYMQALRFLTDYISNDVYYGAKYADHNFVRAGNQIVLLKKLLSREPFLRENRLGEVL